MKLVYATRRFDPAKRNDGGILPHGFDSLGHVHAMLATDAPARQLVLDTATMLWAGGVAEAEVFGRTFHGDGSDRSAIARLLVTAGLRGEEAATVAEATYDLAQGFVRRHRTLVLELAQPMMERTIIGFDDPVVESVQRRVLAAEGQRDEVVDLARVLLERRPKAMLEALQRASEASGRRTAAIWARLCAEHGERASKAPRWSRA